MAQLDKNEQRLKALRAEHDSKQAELERDSDSIQNAAKVEVAEEAPSAVMLQIEQGIRDFQRLRDEAEAEQQADRLKFLESLELKKLVEEQQAQAELDEIKNFEVQEENPQFSDQHEHDKEAFEQFYKEVQELG